jgi:hypothetical protein
MQHMKPDDWWDWIDQLGMVGNWQPLAMVDIDPMHMMCNR